MQYITFHHYSGQVTVTVLLVCRPLECERRKMTIRIARCGFRSKSIHPSALLPCFPWDTNTSRVHWICTPNTCKALSGCL